MSTGIYSWSQTASSNDTADSAINWAEGQLPSSVNNSARAMMSIIAKWRDDLAGVQPSNAVQTTGGTANAQTLTSNGSIGALTNGWTVTWKAGVTNTGAVTLNVDTLGAKHIYRISGTDLSAGDIATGQVYTTTYHQPADAWLLHNATSNLPIGTIVPYAGSSAPTGWLLCDGTAVSRTTYATLFGIISTTYGSGDNSTTFNLPDCTGRTLFGKEASATRLTSAVSGLDGGTLGATGGAESFTLSSANHAAHTHGAGSFAVGTSCTGPADAIVRGASTNTTTVGSGGTLVPINTGTVTISLNSGTVTGTSGSQGSGTAKGHVPPGLIINYIIKY